MQEVGFHTVEAIV